MNIFKTRMNVHSSVVENVRYMVLVTRKVWTELKTGINGWKTSQVTKYRCKIGNMERKVTRDVTAQNTESGIRKQALGRADEFPGTDLRISGRSNYGAGALK